MLLKRHFGANAPIMEAIMKCESGGNQFEEDGSVLISKLGTDDRGLFQIHVPIWGEDIKKIGVDIHTIEGNIIFAKHILEKQGLTAWNPSSKCWRPIINKM